MAENNPKIFDVIIFGASGFTGKYVIREALKFLDAPNSPLTSLALAGRSPSRMSEALNWAASPHPPPKIPLLTIYLSEISMPGIITGSVFSALNGETLMFYRRSQLLILLCVTSGICSGLQSGCFAIANMVLVKRLKETVFRSLLLQDISFFDSEAVGELTSRLGVDCQRLPRTIENDLHLILRNIIQGLGSQWEKLRSR